MSQGADQHGARLEHFRPYLRLLVRMQLGAALAAKLDASDLAQQTLVEAWRGLDRLRARDEAEVAGWLRGILAHVLAHAVRDLHRDKRDVARERSLEQALAASSARLEAWLAAEQSSPSERAEHNEEVIRLAAALERLPEAQREAVTLHYFQAWTLAQVAQHLGRSPAAVAGLVQRGLKQLRRLLQAEG
jgi:RNA polymerase sigma-70 factor (ECF subfamily)